MGAISSTNSVQSGIASTTSGARFGTVTSKRCSAVRSCPSRAVTVIVAGPFASAVTATESPETETAATSGSDETAV